VDVPAFLQTVATPVPPAPTAGEEATRRALELDDAMQRIYDAALAHFQENILANCPIILGLFSGGGGEFWLFRPGFPPEEADPPPVGYQTVKGISHSSMAIYQLLAPHLGDPASIAWRAPTEVYRLQQQQVLELVDDLDELPDDVRGACREILEANIAYMTACLDAGTFDVAGLETFARGLKTQLHATIGFAASVQVSHWMEVLEGWREALGDDWERTYGATNSLYVTRTNNILYTVLAQFFGRESFNERLLLFETTQFDTTPEQMLDLLSRIIADRALGQVFFKDYFLMDVELLGSGGRDAVANEVHRRTPASGGVYATAPGHAQIAQEARERGIEPLLPPLAPFHSHGWPWRTDASEGEGASTIAEAYEEADTP
jgi:hypothetical protein